MSLTNTVVKAVYNANGITTSFPITFDRIANDQVVVFLVNPTAVPSVIPQVVGTHYNISGNNVVFVTAPVSPFRVVVSRSTSLQQLIDYINTGEFIAEDHEKGLDRIVMMLQELASRAPLVPESVALAPLTPPGYPIAGRVLGINALGTGWEFFESAPSVTASTFSVARPAPLNNNAIVPVDPAVQKQIIYLQSNSGTVTLNAATPFQNGAIDGQELLITGVSFTNPVIIPNSGNMDLISNILIEKNRGSHLIWDAGSSRWVEFMSSI